VKAYRGKTVVQGVSVTVNAGEIVGLLGPNGAGKTTTFYMIVGLIRPTAGKIFFKGKDISRLPMFERARSGMGYLAQEPSIFRKLTVADNIMAILETRKLTVRQRKQRLQELMEDLGIAGLAKQMAFTLSGGERRRLEIARALVTEPAMILLDEPFSGVDPLAVYDVQEIIRSLKKRGLGILITDHSVRETLSIVDRAYLICEGRVLRELYLGPRFSM
jgi:lipopolysaccharide export system ATP-binding protein